MFKFARLGPTHHDHAPAAGDGAATAMFSKPGLADKSWQ